MYILELMVVGVIGPMISCFIKVLALVINKIEVSLIRKMIKDKNTLLKLVPWREDFRASVFP